MATRKRPPKRDINNLAGLRVGLYCRVSLDKDGTEKSTDDQRAVGEEWIERVGARVADVYSDPDRSASRFATRERENFTRLVADIEAGKLDAIWFWELSRSQRRLDVFAKLRDLCRDHGVLWVIRDRVYDPHSYADMMTLGMLSVIGENESELISERVSRGQRSSALAGRPAGIVTFGYRRIYDPATRQFVRQEPNVWGGDGGGPVEDSPAWVVREIFRRVAAGDGLIRICRDLNDRRVPLARAGAPTPKSCWQSVTVRRIALNPAYIGRRVYQGEVLADVEAAWPPLVDEETFWAVHRILNDPARVKTRPSAAKSLLSCLVTCGKCGGPVAGNTRSGYRCRDRGCTSISGQRLDDHVEEIMIRWLSDPKVYAQLTRVDDSAIAARARAERAEAVEAIRQLERDVKRGEVTARMATAEESAHQAKIDEADQLLMANMRNPVVVNHAGPEAEAKWRNASVAVKRQIIQAVADITLVPTGNPPGGSRWYGPTVAERVEWRPLMGPNAGEVIRMPPSTRVRMAPNHARALDWIDRDGSIAQSDLPRFLGMARGPVSNLVRRLIQRGWVTKERGHSDGVGGARTFILTLTSDGRQALADINGDGR